MKILGTENDWRNEFGELNKIQQLFASYVCKLYVEFIGFYHCKCVMIRSSFQTFLWRDNHIASTLQVSELQVVQCIAISMETFCISNHIMFLF